MYILFSQPSFKKEKNCFISISFPKKAIILHPLVQQTNNNHDIVLMPKQLYFYGPFCSQ